MNDRMGKKKNVRVWGCIYDAFHAFSKELLFVLVCIIVFVGFLRTVAELPITLKVVIAIGVPALLLGFVILALVRGVRKNIITLFEIATAAGLILSYVVLRYFTRNM